MLVESYGVGEVLSRWSSWVVLPFYRHRIRRTATAFGGWIRIIVMRTLEMGAELSTFELLDT